MIKQLNVMIVDRIRHTRGRLEFNEKINWENRSLQAKAFSAGQTQAWISELYFLESLLNKEKD